MSDKSELNILISGAGIAGLTAAHFLLRAGHKVTIVERAPELRASGQNVDIRGHARTILQRMKTSNFDAEFAVKSKTTRERGLRFVDEANTSRAEFPVDDGTAFTGEIEIMRGDLANILYESVRNMPGFEAIFASRVTQLGEQAGNVFVDIVNETGQCARDNFDLVVAADGISSFIRSMALGTSANEAVKPLGQWSCWFSVPWTQTDDEWARWYNAPKGRMILIRPDNSRITRVSLWTMTRNKAIESSLTRLLGANISEQKQFWAELFQNAGWEAARVLRGLETSDDFHMQKIAQVKLDKWSAGRVVMVGDAACCPSPVSGMGVTTAMTGAYVLAGEISANPTDLRSAIELYERKMHPFVSKAQQLAPGTPGAANPETSLGIWLLYTFLGFVAWTRLYKLLGSSINPPSQAMDLPSYAI